MLALQQEMRGKSRRPNCECDEEQEADLPELAVAYPAGRPAPICD